VIHTALEPGRTLLIGGTWQATERVVDVVDPWSGAVIGQSACADQVHVAAAIASAVKGAAAMRALSTGARARLLQSVAEALEREAERFAQAITAETGKPISNATREVVRAVNTLRLSAEEATRLSGETLPFDSFPGGEQRSGHYLYEPAGVIAAITPFNDPLNLVCHKLGPAFAAGNSVVLKPAKQAPLVAVMLARLFLSHGLPADALNVLTGAGREIGNALVAHPEVAMVSFTGGVVAGEAIARGAGIKRLAMELGGNGAVIVMPDADLEKATDACVSGAFGVAGQNCIGVQRILVHDRIYDTFRERMIARTRALKVGNPADPETEVGSMIDASAAERITAWIDQALAGGARLLSGGERTCALVQPALLENVPPGASLACEEAFGPVAGLFRFDDLEEAIATANAPAFMIHAAIFTRSLETASLAVRGLKAAGVMVNDSTDYRLDAMPFGGAGRGNMGREGVRFAMREMSQTKVVCFNHD
jgi:glyceraldehyde-3-phosphate dehydrogenase (NADP+)